MKQMIFFDGDGTLWYPKLTKYEKKPDWIYENPKTRVNPNIHLELTPNAREAVRDLHSRRLVLGILSASPRPPDHANRVLREKVKYFGLERFFEEVHATQRYQACKGDYIVEILKRRGLPKVRALMVGDNYDWDYQSARWQGVDAVLIDSDYRREHAKGRHVRRTITELKDVLKYI